MGRFQVLFSGEVAQGASEATVRQNLMRRLGLDERKVAQLFSGRTVVIRGDLTREGADQLQGELAELGAMARIKDLAPDDRARFRVDAPTADHTLKDITAAHVECPRCGHLQLESEYCARCGVEIATAMKQKRKEDLLIEKKIRGLKDQKPSAMPPVATEPASAPEGEERLQPIKRRMQRHGQRPRMRAPAAHRVAATQAAPETSSSNPFGGFWRNVLKLGRKDDRGH